MFVAAFKCLLMISLLVGGIELSGDNLIDENLKMGCIFVNSSE